MPKFTELPGASPPGPPPGLCPGPAGGLTAPPRPPAVFLVPMAAPLPKCFRRACTWQSLYNNSEQTTNKWTANDKIIAENQAGFRKGYQTSDHISRLQTLAKQYINKKQKIFPRFVDF